MSLLPQILPEFTFLILDIVRNELPALVLAELQNMIQRDRTIAEETFGKNSGECREYARLISASGLGLGRGESACMVYCLYHNDVLGSSNLRDVRQYCDDNGITYLTTIDFLFYAISRGVMSRDDAETFCQKVVAMGSKLPQVDFDTYFCDKI